MKSVPGFTESWHCERWRSQLDRCAGPLQWRTSIIAEWPRNKLSPANQRRLATTTSTTSSLAASKLPLNIPALCNNPNPEFLEPSPPSPRERTSHEITEPDSNHAVLNRLVNRPPRGRSLCRVVLGLRRGRRRGRLPLRGRCGLARFLRQAGRPIGAQPRAGRQDQGLCDDQGWI